MVCDAVSHAVRSLHRLPHSPKLCTPFTMNLWKAVQVVEPCKLGLPLRDVEPQKG
jgi:hypothetical protein